jgi:hypothetical protein
MSIQPQGEALRKAVKYISEEKTADPEVSLNLLIQKACMKFDLTPKDTDYLDRFYKSGGKAED